MSTERVNRLRKRFILISMSSFMLVMLFTGFFVNIAYTHATRKQMYQILEQLIENEGNLPKQKVDDIEADEYSVTDQINYGMRYFSVILDSDDSDADIETIDLQHVGFLDQETAEKYVRVALKNFFGSGSIGGFYYEVADLSDGKVIVAFVNSSIQLQIKNQVIKYTVLICGAGLFITGLIVWLLSKRAIQSEIENVVRQKEFITNASHELKTPLAVIRANTEITEMMSGETEWTESTLRQVEHMNGLIQNLVMIARSAEQEDKGQRRELDLTSVVKSVVEPFEAVALKEYKTLELNLDPDVKIWADESTLRQLISILTDNAMKYCDEDGNIAVKLSQTRRGKGVLLTVSNSYAEGANVDYRKFFDRFYREDTSHNNQKGYGIGLSMAESICRQYQGKIQAEWKDGVISFVCLLNSNHNS